jgi:hypothetical protein
MSFYYQRDIESGGEKASVYTVRMKDKAVGDTNGNDRGGKKINYLFYLAVLSMIGLFGFAGVSSNSLASTQVSKSIKDKMLLSVRNPVRSKDIIFTSLADLSIYAANEYGHYEGQYSFFDEYEGSQLIEPFKTTTIKLNGLLVDAGEFSFLWTIEGYDEVLYGDAVSITWGSETGLYAIQVDVYKSDGEYVASLVTTLIVK